MIKNFIKNENGATAIEYGLIAGFISIVVVAAGPAIGAGLLAKFNLVLAGLQ